MPPAAYSRLDPARIVATLDALVLRIGERFPDSGLLRVATETAQVGRLSEARTHALMKPAVGLRALQIGVALGAIALGVRVWPHEARIEGDALSLVQALDAAVNLALLAAGGAWFLLTLEERLKRRRALAALHELRSLAHVIDMHQLTKDPTILLSGYQRTKHAPQRTMTRFELTRYLEYCSELLALIGKLAALYGEGMRDPVVIEASNDIEQLCADLGRKIWQKINIFSQLAEQGPPA